MTTRTYKNSWTPEEDARLAKCVADGMMTKDIAPLLPNRGFYAIAKRRARQKLKGASRLFPHDDPATVAQIVKFRMAGWRLADIEAVTRVNRARLSRLVTRTGIKLPPVIRMPATNKNRWTPLEIDRLQSFLEDEIPVETFSVLFANRTPAAVRKKAYLLQKNKVSVERTEAWRETVIVQRSMSISELRDKELTVDEIADITGKSRVDVFNELQGN